MPGIASMRAAPTDVGAELRRARARRLAGLYALTPDLDDTDLLVAKVTAALEGGAAAVQYRHKFATEALRRAQATALSRVHTARGALFLVNDDPRLAAEVGADGVHLGRDDPGPGAARELLGPDRLIGVSCYDDFDRARAAVAAGADYVAFGSFFPSATKPDARRADAALLVRARELGVPIVAIGGIDAGNARALIDAGADALAVIRDVFAHDDPGEIARAAAAIAACFASLHSSRV
jgi:thiamine-phosphate pyrophosphorylase